MFAFRRQIWLVSLAALAVLCLPSLGQAATTTSGGITLPGPQVAPKMGKILPLARRELRRNVVETKGDNVPRYKYGKGKIAPYSIGDQWCAAFATWIWNRAGFKAYLGTSILWKAFDGTSVAVQVKDLSDWAEANGYFSFRARPGYLVAYGVNHIGIVAKINRKSGKAVASIEGNLKDRVTRVKVPMEKVTGYISPVRLNRAQLKKSAAYPDMIVEPQTLEEVTEATPVQP